MKHSFAFLLLSVFPFLTFSQHHEWKLDLLEFVPNNLEWNVGYEYVYKKDLGLYIQAGYEVESYYNNYPIPRSGPVFLAATYRIPYYYRENIQRNQFKLLVMGKYYAYNFKDIIYPYTGVFINGDILLKQTIDITPNLGYSGSNLSPAPNSRLNSGMVFGSKFLLFKQRITLEPEFGIQFNLLRLVESGTYGAFNIGYRFATRNRS